MLNNICVMGRFTKDPELKYTANTNTAVLLFALAVERDYKSADGKRGVDFIDCQAWRTTAEHIAKYFKKGQLCVVEGRLQTRIYNDNDGSRRKAVEIIVNNIYFATAKTTAAGETTNGFAEVNDDDMDLPF